MPVIKKLPTSKHTMIESGLGQGEGKNYKPYIDVIHVSTKGRATREKGWKTERIHHFLSDLETMVFYLYEFAENVIDIREHFPLVEDFKEFETTLDRKLKKRLVNQKTDEQFVITTSFLLTIKEADGHLRYVARAVKDSRQIDKDAAIDRLEIQRRYWASRGIDFGLITNRDIPKQKAKNIEMLHSSYWLEDYDFSKWDKEFLLENLQQEMSQSKLTVQEVVQDFDDLFELEKGTGLLMYKHLIATKKIEVDLTSPLRFDRPIEETFVKESVWNVSSKSAAGKSR